jgi:hypothetical protein
LKVSSTSDTDEGLGHGLGLIIDKLKNIETKLDELKTIDQVRFTALLQNNMNSKQSIRLVLKN